VVGGEVDNFASSSDDRIMVWGTRKLDEARMWAVQRGCLCSDPFDASHRPRIFRIEFDGEICRDPNAPSRCDSLMAPAAVISEIIAEYGDTKISTGPMGQREMKQHLWSDYAG